MNMKYEIKYEIKIKFIFFYYNIIKIKLIYDILFFVNGFKCNAIKIYLYIRYRQHEIDFNYQILIKKDNKTNQK